MGTGDHILGWLQPHIPVTRPSPALALGSFSTATSSAQSNSARPSQHLQHPPSHQCSQGDWEGLQTVEEGLPGRCCPVPHHHHPQPSRLYQTRIPLESPSSAKTASKVLGAPLSQPFSTTQLTPLHIPLKSWHSQPACCGTAATPLPACVCGHKPSSLCRVPAHVDPEMLHLLLSNCQKFTGSSQMPLPEFRGGGRVKTSRSGDHRRQRCAAPGFSPPSTQGFAPQNLHSG